MGINLLKDLGYDEGSAEVRKAREAAAVYASVIDSLAASREQSGLSQKQLAKRMGTTQSAVSELENASADARFSTIMRYAQAVNCEIHISVTPTAAAVHSQNSDWVTLEVERAEGVSKKSRIMTSSGFMEHFKTVRTFELAGSAK